MGQNSEGNHPERQKGLQTFCGFKCHRFYADSFQHENLMLDEIKKCRPPLTNGVFVVALTFPQHGSSTARLDLS